jgi:hypothetical protein
MELGNFITAEKSVKITGIQPGQWFVARRYDWPWRVFQCKDVTDDGHGVVRSEPIKGQHEMFSSWNCHVLDSNYDQEQLFALQQRAFLEFESYNVACRTKTHGLDAFKEVKP